MNGINEEITQETISGALRITGFRQNYAASEHLCLQKVYYKFVFNEILIMNIHQLMIFYIWM